MEPAVGFDGLGGGFRLLPIAGKDKRPPHQQFTIGGEAAFHGLDRLAHRAHAVIPGIVQGQHRRGFGKPVALEDTNADIGKPARCVERPAVLPRRYSRALLPPKACLTFLKTRRSAKRQRSEEGVLPRRISLAVAVAGGERPVKELFDRGFGARSLLHLIANFLVDPGHGDKDRGLDGSQGGGQPVEVSAVGQGRAVTEERVVQVAGGDMRKRQKGDAGGVGVSR